MMPKKTDKGKILVCKCGYKEEGEAKITETQDNQNKKIEVVSDEELETMPITDEAECEKCGNKEAYYYTAQTRSGDEPETKFLICTKCGHKWRDYG